MKQCCRCALAVTLAVAPAAVASLTVNPAFAQVGQPSPEALQSILEEALALVTGGLVAPPQHASQVTRDGETYHVSIPLPGMTTPPNAAIDAVARPLDGGAWDITSLVLPRTGTMPMAGTDSPGTMWFSIGQQAIHAKIEPDLARPSPFAAELHDVELQSDENGRHAEQTIERYSLEGSVSGQGPVAGATDQRLNVQSHGSALNWRLNTSDKTGITATGLIVSAVGHFNVKGLDRRQAERLTIAGRSLGADLQTARTQAKATPPMAEPRPDQPAPATPPDVPAPSTPTRDKAPVSSPLLLSRLRVMIDACKGLLSQLDTEETLRRIHFDAGGMNHGDVGQVRVALSSEVRNNRLNAQLAVTVDELTLSAVPVDLAAYVPRHIDVAPAVSNVPTELLLRLLRDATATDSDQPTLGPDLAALLDDPDARVGIESLSFSSGPLRVTGSGLLRKHSDGKAGIDIHLVATGLNALIAEAQGNPRVQPILPMVFLAKGIARPLGEGLVWDIVFSDGNTTVNGMPLGQPSPTRRAPSSR
jgi:hypothetical protein